MKFKKIWLEFSHFLKLIKKDHANIIWIMILGALAGAAQPFIQLVFYSKILDLVLSKSYEDCVLYVVILLSSTLVLNLISQACKQTIEVLGDACNDTIYLRTAGKAFSMEYEEFEKTETMDAIRRVRGGENGAGGIGSQIQSIYNMAEQVFATLFSFVFVVSLLFRVNANDGSSVSFWSILGILAVFAAVMTICLRLSAASYKKYYEVGKKNEHINSL
jgi:ATP-binding cassette subfamily B protein